MTRIGQATFWRQPCAVNLGRCVAFLKELLGLILKSIYTSWKMLVITLGWLVVFDLVGFSPVDAIPKPTLNRISRFKPSPEEQIVIDETSEIKLRTSRLQNWYHDTCTFTGDIWTQTSSTHNGDSSKS